jgi:hypothetical protein
MWSGRNGYVMPSYVPEVDVLHALTVEMDVVGSGEAFDLLGNTQFSAMLLVQERRNDCNEGPR